MDEWNYTHKYKEIIEEVQRPLYNERPNTNSTWNTEEEVKKEKYNTLSLFTLVQKFLNTIQRQGNQEQNEGEDESDQELEDEIQP